MGYAYVALEDVGTDSRPPVLQPGARFPLIPAAPSRSLTMDATVDAAKQDVQQLTDLLHSVLDRKTIASLRESLGELQTTMQALTAHGKKLDAIFRNAQAASTNAAAASRRISPLLESSQQTVEAMQTELLPEADQTLVKLHQLSNSLEEITAEIQRDPPSSFAAERHRRRGPANRSEGAAVARHDGGSICGERMHRDPGLRFPVSTEGRHREICVESASDRSASSRNRWGHGPGIRASDDAGLEFSASAR